MPHGQKSTIVYLTVLIVMFVGCAAPHRAIQLAMPKLNSPAVRVLLPLTANEYRVDCTGYFTTRVVDASGDQNVYYCTRPIKLVYERSRWTLYDNSGAILEHGLVQIALSPKNRDDHLSINDKPYAGSLMIYPPRIGTTTPQVINIVNVDDYLLGVLPPELGLRNADEFDAVKAQAVAARTYALSHLGQYPSADYDLRADHMDQIYIGLEKPYGWVKNAVQETAGEVLRYRGDLIDAYYHSTCGGYTDDITAVWGKDPVPYLVGVEDTFCRWSKYYRWSESWDIETLKTNLRRYLESLDNSPFKRFDRIISLRTEGQTPGGRIEKMIVVTDRGDWTILGDQVRWALGRPSIGGSILQSARFELSPEYNERGQLARVVADGGGYGHGVGMCQCGMIGRARAGQNYREILQYFYAGAMVEKTY